MNIEGEVGAELELVWVNVIGLRVDGAFPAEAVPGGVL
jgi:hypothetical protein